MKRALLVALVEVLSLCDDSVGTLMNSGWRNRLRIMMTGGYRLGLSKLWHISFHILMVVGWFIIVTMICPFIMIIFITKARVSIALGRPPVPISWHLSFLFLVRLPR